MCRLPGGVQVVLTSPYPLYPSTNWPGPATCGAFYSPSWVLWPLWPGLVCRPARRPTRSGPKPSPLARLSMAEAAALLLLHPAPSGPLLLSRQGDPPLAFRALRNLRVPPAWVRHSPEGGAVKIRPNLLGGSARGVDKNSRTTISPSVSNYITAAPPP
jgi:hypothetical protein